MCDTFFCHACQRHKPLADKRTSPTGKRPICDACLVNLHARTKPVTFVKRMPDGVERVHTIKAESARKSRINVANKRTKETAEWLSNWARGR